MTNAIAKQESNPFEERLAYWQDAVKTNLLPKGMTAAQAVLIEAKGREIGLSPLRAVQTLVVVNGKLSMSAEGMLALIYERATGAVIDIIERNEKIAVVEVKKTSANRASKFTFSIEDAVRAGLANGDVWRKFPQDMLFWRCISRMGRSTFPEYFQGVTSIEEAEDADLFDRTGAPRVASNLASVIQQPQVVAQPKAAKKAESKAEPKFIDTQAEQRQLPQSNDVANNPPVANEAPKPSISKAVQGCIDWFSGKGLDAETILANIGRESLEDITEADLAILRTACTEVRGQGAKPLLALLSNWWAAKGVSAEELAEILGLMTLDQIDDGDREVLVKAAKYDDPKRVLLGLIGEEEKEVG